MKQATTTEAYANAVRNLSVEQAKLALSTKNLSAEQQREILLTAGLIKETGSLTVAQATEALTTDTRNAADVEALMLKAGLITELGAETTATITVDAAKLKELVDTKVLTQAEAELLAMKAGVTLQSTKEAATLIASNAKLGSSFAIMGKTASAALKGIGKGLLSFASAHPILAIGATIIGSVAFFNSELKKLEEEQEELISNAKALQEEYRNFTKDTSGKINSLTSQADEFNELSKGVDKYGNNISLASDEYDRYKAIVAEILGYSPELIQGYDAEGNAIADKNGLLERSIELLKEEQRLKLKEMTTDEKTGEAYDAAEAGWQQVQGYEGANTRNEIARWFDNNAFRDGTNYEVDIAEILGIKDEWKEEGNNLQNAIINNIDTVVKNIKDKKEELLAIRKIEGFDSKKGEYIYGDNLFSVDEIDNMIDLSNDWQYAYNQWQQDIEDAKHGMDDQFNLYAQRAKSYNDLTDAQKVFVDEYIRATGDITDAEGHLLSEDKILEKAKGYEKFVNEFAELNKLGEGGSVDLTFRPEIDTEELNKKGWEAGEGFATVFSSAISNTDFDDLMPENAEDTVAINFTPIIVDPNTGEFKGVLSEEELYAYAHDVLAGVREDDLNLQIGAKFEGKDAIDKAVADGERIHYLHEKLFINNDTVDSWEDLRKVLVKTGDDAAQAGENVNKMTVSMESLKESFEAVETAISEYNKTGYLSVETFEKLMALEPEYLNMLIDENGNLNLNTEAVQANTAAYIENMGVKAAQNLIDTVSGMKGTAEQLEYLTGITNENTEATWANIYTQLAQADAVSDPAVMDALYSRINTIKAMTDATLAGISKGGLSGKSKAEDTAKKRREQQEKQYNADLQYRIDKITQSLEKYTKRLEQLKEAQDDLYEDDYIGKIDYINQRYEVQSQYTEETKKELDSLLETIPQTAEGWNKLASAVENVSEKYFESKRALIDYQVELSKAYMDALKMVSETPKSALDDSINQYSRNVKMLTEGGLGGLKFRLTPIVPEDAVAKQRKENEELAKEEEAYQEKVNEIKQRALDEMKAYEDQQRAEQLAQIESDGNQVIANLGQNFTDTFKQSWDDFKEYCEANSIDFGAFATKIVDKNSSGEWKKNYAEMVGASISKESHHDGTVDWLYELGGHKFSGIEGLQKYVEGLEDATSKVAFAKLHNIEIIEKPNREALGLDSGGEGWVYKYRDKYYENLSEIKPLVNNFAKGGTATGDIIVNEEGQESYLGKDGKLHLFKPGAQFFNTDEVVRVFNAEDTKKIRKYTGDKYFNEPIGDLSKVTQLANGNIKAVFPAVTPENTNNNEDIAQLSEKATEEHYDRMGDIQNKALNEEIAMDAEAQAITEVQKEQHYDKMEIAQQTTNDITSQEQIVDNAEKVTEEKRFGTETEGVVTELLNWMKNNPIKAPGLDTASWKQMISDAQGYMSQLMGGFGTGVRGEINGDMPYYNQGDYSAYTYGGKPMNTNACAPTSMAMVLSYLGKNVNPVEAAKYSEKNGFYTSGQGTSWGLFDSMAKAYGVNCDTIGSSSSAIISSLKAGRPVIVSVNGGTFNPSGRGHLFVLAGIDDNGKIIVNDPGSRERTSKTWDISAITSNARNAWSFYATGTKDYGVAGENYKKEFLIDKKTGRWTEVNSPTLIDTNEVDVVGEKASAKIDKPLPMYANGTLGTMDMSSEMPKLTTEQIQKILSTNFANSKLNVAGAAEGIFNAQQSTGVSALAMLAIAAGESGWGTSKLSNAKNNYWGWNHYSANGKSAFDRATTFSSNPGEAFTAYGEKLKSAGYSEQSLAEMADKYCPDGKWYGLVSGTMSTIVNTLNDAGLGDMSANIATTASNTTSIRRSFDQQIKDFLSGSWNSESSETYEDVLMNVIREGVKTSDAYTQEYLEGFNSLITSQDNYETGYKERYEKLLAAKGTPEFDEIKNDLTEYTRNHVEDVLSASTKMNTAYAKSQYDIISQMYDAAIAHYNKRLSEGASADELKVYADSINVLQDQKNDLSDNYVQAIQDETNQITSVIDRDFRKFDDELSWYDEDESDTGKRYENISKRNEINQRKESSAKEGFAELLNDPKFAKIIELNGGNIEDWFDRDGNISATFEEFMSTHAASELSSDDMAYAKQLVTIGSAYKKEMVEASDAVKDSAEAMADLKIEEYIKYQERLVESLEFDATLSQSLSTAKEGMYSLFKTLRDEKAEMEKELKANMQIDDWLTEDTRRQLFNLDDYEEQMGVINEIEAEAQSLYAEYQNDLANLKEDELYKEEEITAEYNRQLESLQDKLSIAKADLQLAKDKAAFENALKERDTQIIMGNRVQNVADPERLREAAMKVAESESALENEKTTSAENQDIRNMEATTGMINQEKGAIQNRIDMINGMTEEERRVFADFLEPLQAYRNKLLALTKTNPYRIITGDNSNSVFASRDYSKIAGYSLTQDHSAAVDEIQYLLDNGYYKQGTPEYDVALKTIDILKKQHDDKTTSDAHNYGYDLYDPANSVNWYRYMKMYTDLGYAIQSQERPSVDETMLEAYEDAANNLPVISGEGEILVSANKKPHSSTTFSGDGDISLADGENVGINEFNDYISQLEKEWEENTISITPYSGLFEDYKEVSLAEMISPLLDDSSMAESIAQSIVSGAIAPNIDTIASVFSRAQALDLIKNGNNDNSIHMQNVNVTLEKPVADPNDFIQQLISKVNSEYSTTNNQR